MPRNAAVMRQWKILRELDARRLGATVGQLVDAARDEDDRTVTVRTVYRDLRALQDVGFLIHSAPRQGDEAVKGEVVYKLDQSPFSRLTQTGFSFSELCALYVSRRVVESLTGLPFQTSLRDAFQRLEQVINPRMLHFLNELPLAVSAKPLGGKVPQSPETQHFGNLLVEATMRHHVVEMLYFSGSKKRKKTYRVHPLRMVYSQGAFYMYAYVPEYKQIRTFVTHRIRQLTVLEETFQRPPDVPDERDMFGPSLGPGQGRPMHAVFRIDAEMAQYVKERQFDKSQRTVAERDGSLRLEMDVCNDPFLKVWVLGFGRHIQVIEPPELAEEIKSELKAARVQYEESAVSAAFLELSTQGRLPFSMSSDRPAAAADAPDDSGPASRSGRQRRG